MSVYKSSNLQPNLQEIDVTDNNTFSCQINTSGNPVKAYKMNILSTDGETVIYDGPATDLAVEVENKGTLNIPNIRKADIPSLENGQDYQWGVRVYESVLDSDDQPRTLVGSGYLVGSTKYVIWTGNNENLQIDRWVEFNTIGTDELMPVPNPNTKNMVLPLEGEKFRERKKISWVEKELGWDKDFTKLEMEEDFKYNYKNRTKFEIYLCSDQHTLNSVYVDPNDVIELGYFIEIYKGSKLVESKRKITGYGQETGEIRVQQAFNEVPLNGYNYKLYSYDYTTSQYTEVTFTEVSNIIGGAPVRNVVKQGYVTVYVIPNYHIENGYYFQVYQNGEEQSKKIKIIEYDNILGKITLEESLSHIPTNGQNYKLYSYNQSTGEYEEIPSNDVKKEIGGLAHNDVHYPNYGTVYVKPNGYVEVGQYIELFNGDSLVETKREIIACNNSIGEIQVQEPFDNIPKNGLTYKLYTYNSETGIYTPVDFTHANNLATITPLSNVCYTQPNSFINVNDYVEIYSGASKLVDKNKITAYNLENGEVTLETLTASFVPSDRYTYKLYSKSGETYTEKVFANISNSVTVKTSTTSNKFFKVSEISALIQSGYYVEFLHNGANPFGTNKFKIGSYSALSGLIELETAMSQTINLSDNYYTYKIYSYNSSTSKYTEIDLVDISIQKIYAAFNKITCAANNLLATTKYICLNQARSTSLNKDILEEKMLVSALNAGKTEITLPVYLAYTSSYGTYNYQLFSKDSDDKYNEELFSNLSNILKDSVAANIITIDSNILAAVDNFMEVYTNLNVNGNKIKITRAQSDNTIITLENNCIIENYSDITQCYYNLYTQDETTEDYTQLYFANILPLVSDNNEDADKFFIITNAWDSTAHQLFIQPNINIKTDDRNPNEIVFDNDGIRLDIVKQTSTTQVPRKTVDITFNKLDDTQWLLTSFNPDDYSKPVVVTPKTYYKVYTDFMDSMPNGVFYGRTTPTIEMKYKDGSGQTSGDYILINEEKRVTIQPNSFLGYVEGSATNWYLQAYDKKGNVLYLDGSPSATKNKIVGYDINSGDIHLENKFAFTTACPELTTRCTFKIYRGNTEIPFTGIMNSFNAVTLSSNVFTVEVQKNTLIQVGDKINLFDGTTSIGRLIPILSASTSGNVTTITFSSTAVSSPESVQVGNLYRLYNSAGTQEKYFYDLSNYFRPFRSWRDMDFVSVWTSVNYTNIKYYQYILYDNTGSVLGQSEETYNTSLRWSFKGLDSGYENSPQPGTLPIIFPTAYELKLRIVDTYDKEFTQIQKFSTYYSVESGSIPLEIQEICEEQAMNIIPSVPQKVISTDLKDDEGEIIQPTIVSTDMKDNMLMIPDGKCLNYDRIVDTGGNIVIPDEFGYLAQFRLGTPDMPFLDDSIQAPSETTIMKIIHNRIRINEFEEEEIIPEEFEVKIGGLYKYYQVEEGGQKIYKTNPDYMTIKIYNLDSDTPDEAIYCFENGTSNTYSLVENDDEQDFATIRNARFALQSTNAQYHTVDTLDASTSVNGEFYIARNSSVVVINGVTYIYYSGFIYQFNGVYFVLQSDAEYVYVENLNQFEGSTFASLVVPANAQGEDGNILWEESGNQWLDSTYLAMINKLALYKKWFTLYFTVRKEDENQIVRCTINMSRERS